VSIPIADLIRAGKIHPDEPICERPEDLCWYSRPVCRCVYLPATTFPKNLSTMPLDFPSMPGDEEKPSRTCGKCLRKIERL